MIQFITTNLLVPRKRWSMSIAISLSNAVAACVPLTNIETTIATSVSVIKKKAQKLLAKREPATATPLPNSVQLKTFLKRM